MSNTKHCPIMNGTCIESNCKLYHNGCDISNIASNLEVLYRNIELLYNAIYDSK